MNLNSLIMLLFVTVSVIIYYLIPKRFQPFLLLILSIIYYISNGFGAFFFILSMARMPLPVVIILSILSSYVLNGIVGAIYYFLPDLKDGEGEFVV